MKELSCTTVPPMGTRNLWEDIQEGFRDVNSQIGGALSEYWLVEGLYSGTIELHIAATEDEIEAFAITQKLYDATGCWLDIVLGKSNGRLDAFQRLLSYIESLVASREAKGTKMALSNERLVGVMTSRYGYTKRLVEVLKEVEA